MNDAGLAILLGIIEGLTEFLPVSSTAHLRIAEGLFKINLQDPYWKMFTIVIQLGAICSLFVYFSGRLVKLLRPIPDRPITSHPLVLVIIAFVVTAIPAKLLTKVIGDNLESMKVIGFALLIGGIVMWVVDALLGDRPEEVSTNKLEQMSIFQAVFVGAAQILSAVFPGTSRSMSTIAGGQLVGLTRSAALEFSFLVSIPTMLAATGYSLLKAMKGKDTAGNLTPMHLDAHGYAILAIGTVVSFIVALGVVAWFMAWVRRRGFVPFAVYRIVVGIAVLVWAYRSAGG
jgi:undecaprenyl-diphosphatase